jgi:hypothetical protein
MLKVILTMRYTDKKPEMRDILKRNPIEVEAKEVGFKLC